MSGGLTTVDVQDLAGRERGTLEKRIPSTTSLISPTRRMGCSAAIPS
jgi:hypothetical protein